MRILFVGNSYTGYNELTKLIEEGRKELGDNNRIGQGARFFDDASKTKRIDEYNKWLESESNKK